MIETQEKKEDRDKMIETRRGGGCGTVMRITARQHGEEAQEDEQRG